MRSEYEKKNHQQQPSFTSIQAQQSHQTEKTSFPGGENSNTLKKPFEAR